MDVVGVALMFSVQGHSHRTMAAQLGLPAETVRGWIRRVNRRAEWLRIEGTTAAAAFDPTLTAIEPTASRSPLAEAFEALGLAAAAAQRLFGTTATPWQFIAVLARGQPLGPRRSG